MVNRTFGQPAHQLHERHDAGDFDTRTQDKLSSAAPDLEPQGQTPP
jgi:GST-like protein